MTQEFKPPKLSDDALALHKRMLKAAKEGNNAAVIECLEAGANPNTPIPLTVSIDNENVNYGTVMHTAIWQNDLPLLKLLIDGWQADPNVTMPGSMPLLETATHATGHHDMVRYLATHPKTDINALNVMGFTAWEAILHDTYSAERYDYYDIILDAKDLVPSPQFPLAIAKLAGSHQPERLARLLKELEVNRADISTAKSNDATLFTDNLPMGAAAQAGDLESMHLLKDHGFAVEQDANAEKQPAKLPIVRACIGGNIEAFRQLLEWGADIHATEEDGTNVLTGAVRAACSGHAENAKIMLRDAFIAGVEPRVRTDNTPPPFQHLLPLAIFSQDHEIVQLLIAGGAEPRMSLLNQAINQLKESGERGSSDKIAFTREVINPYTKLPAKLPKDLTGITRAALEKRNANDLCLLDHPNTWFRFHELQAELEKIGEAFSPQELREGTMRLTDRSFMASIASSRGIKDVQAYFEERGDGIQFTDLITPKNEPSDLLVTVVDFNLLPDLFSKEIWQDKSASQLRRTYGALDESQQAKIQNMHQLSVQIARPSQREVA